MDLFTTLKSAQGVTMLSAVTVRMATPDKGTRVFKVTPVKLERDERPTDLVLLAIHYYSHILARYPRENNDLDRFGMELREMMAHVIEEGIWPGANLLAYARVEDKARLAEPGEDPAGSDIEAVLFRTLMSDDLDLALELPDDAAHDDLILSVPAVFAGMVHLLDEPRIELLDKTLRYYRTYVAEGAEFASMAAARSLANKAFREAGGEAV